MNIKIIYIYMSKCRTMGAGLAGSTRMANVNANQGGGSALQGVPSTVGKRPILNLAVRQRGGGQQRNNIFCMNQLGGIGKSSRMFASTADGVSCKNKINEPTPEPKKPREPKKKALDYLNEGYVNYTEDSSCLGDMSQLLCLFLSDTNSVTRYWKGSLLGNINTKLGPPSALLVSTNSSVQLFRDEVTPNLATATFIIVLVGKINIHTISDNLITEKPLGEGQIGWLRCGIGFNIKHITTKVEYLMISAFETINIDIPKLQYEYPCNIENMANNAALGWTPFSYVGYGDEHNEPPLDASWSSNESWNAETNIYDKEAGYLYPFGIPDPSGLSVDAPKNTNRAFIGIWADGDLTPSPVMNIHYEPISEQNNIVYIRNMNDPSQLSSWTDTHSHQDGVLYIPLYYDGVQDKYGNKFYFSEDYREPGEEKAIPTIISAETIQPGDMRWNMPHLEYTEVPSKLGIAINGNIPPSIIESTDDYHIYDPPNGRTFVDLIATQFTTQIYKHL